MRFAWVVIGGCFVASAAFAQEQPIDDGVQLKACQELLADSQRQAIKFAVRSYLLAHQTDAANTAAKEAAEAKPKIPPAAPNPE